MMVGGSMGFMFVLLRVEHSVCALCCVAVLVC